jgi:hypothetical protein
MTAPRQWAGERCSGTPDHDSDGAVQRDPGEGLVEEHIHVDLAGRQLTALGVDDDPGGRLWQPNKSQRRSSWPSSLGASLAAVIGGFNPDEPAPAAELR